MYKKRFKLKMDEYCYVDSLTELRKNFSYMYVIEYIEDGRMDMWLSDRRHNDILNSITQLDLQDKDIKSQIYRIFDVELADELNDEQLDDLYCLYDYDDYDELFYELSAYSKDNSDVQLYYGFYYENEGDYEEAYSWFKKSALQGNSKAQWKVGEIYDSSDYEELVESNSVKAAKWYKRSAKQKDCDGIFNLANYFFYDREDYQAALSLYKQLVSERNKYFSNEHDPDKIYYCIAYSYYYGCGTKRDYVEALKWYNRVGSFILDVEDYINIGNCYFMGTENYIRAIELYRKAAEKGSEKGKRLVGLCYYYGLGVKKSYKKSFEYFKDAADAGDAESQFWLADCYYYGNGTKKDCCEAIKWYVNSADRGCVYSMAVLSTLIKEGNKYFSIEEFCKKMNVNGFMIPTIISANETEIVVDDSVELERLVSVSNLGDAKVEFLIGALYHYGKTVEKSVDQALVWYKKSASKGNMRANTAQRIVFLYDDYQYQEINFQQYYNNNRCRIPSHFNAYNSRIYTAFGVCYFMGDSIDKFFDTALH